MTEFRPLSGRHIILIGGDAGFGLYLAKLFAKQGARLSVLCKIFNKTSKLPSLFKELGDQEHLFLPVNLFSCRDVIRVLSSAITDAGPPDYLINALTHVQWSPILSTNRYDWEIARDYNILTPAAALHTVLPVMLKQGNGLICNFFPMEPMGQMAAAPVTSMSKYALLSLCVSLQSTLPDNKVQIASLLHPYWAEEEEAGAYVLGLLHGDLQLNKKGLTIMGIPS